MINPERGKVNSCHAVFLCGSMSDPTPPRHVGHKVQSSACVEESCCAGLPVLALAVQSSVCQCRAAYALHWGRKRHEPEACAVG